MTFVSVDGVLDFAIAEEEKAAAFYRQLAEKAEAPGLSTTMLELAAEEDLHRDRLVAIKAGDLSQLSTEKVRGLDISDFLLDIEPSPKMSVADALRYAMNAEQVAFQLYSDLAGAAEDPGLATLFRALARQEEHHRVLLERQFEAQNL